MQTPLMSMEQLLPFPTAQEVLAKRSKSTALVSIEPGAMIAAALQTMADRNIGFLAVIERGMLVGVISERDCARRVILGQLPATTTAVREIMTTQVHTVAPEAKITECIITMHAKQVRHLPVVRGSQVTGVLSVRDLMGALIERHERLLRKLAEERLTLMYPDPSSY